MKLLWVQPIAIVFHLDSSRSVVCNFQDDNDRFAEDKFLLFRIKARCEVRAKALGTGRKSKVKAVFRSFRI